MVAPLNLQAAPAALDVLGVILAPGEAARRRVLGRPALDYTLAHARAAASVGRVVVASGCPRVRDLARAAFVPTVELEPELDDAAAVRRAVEAVERRSAWRAGAVAVLDARVPVRPADATDRCVGLLARTGCDSVRTVCPVGGAMSLHDGGCVVIRRAALFGEAGDVLGHDRRGVEVAAGDCLAVEHEGDVAAAEAALRSRGLGPAVRMAA